MPRLTETRGATFTAGSEFPRGDAELAFKALHADPEIGELGVHRAELFDIMEESPERARGGSELSIETALQDRDVTTTRVGLTLRSFRYTAQAGVGAFLGSPSREIGSRLSKLSDH